MNTLKLVTVMQQLVDELDALDERVQQVSSGSLSSGSQHKTYSTNLYRWSAVC